MQPGAGIGGAAVLPDDGVVDRDAGGTVPDQSGLALIGNADGGNFGDTDAGFGNCGAGGAEGGGLQVGRIMFNPA